MIPGWASYRLDELAIIQGGGTPKRSEPAYFGGDIPWVTPSDLPAVGIISKLGRTKNTITKDGLARSSAKLIEPNSVLFSTRASIGKIAVTNTECATNQGFANFTPANNKIDTWFLAFLLQRFTSEIQNLSSKTTFQEVPKGRLKSFKVEVPSLEEQLRIVARIKECMERVDEIEKLRAESLKEAEYLTSSLYESPINKSQYPKVTIGDLVLQTRNGKSISQDNNGSTGRVLSLAAVHGVSLDMEKSKPVILNEKDANKYKIEIDDVFVSRSNTLSLVGLASVATESHERTIFPDLLIQLKPRKEMVRPSYLVYALRMLDSRRQIKDRAFGTSQSMVKISGQRLKEVKIPLPTLREQDIIIDRLDGLNKVSTKLFKEIGLKDYPILRQSILRKAFAGEL